MGDGGLTSLSIESATGAPSWEVKTGDAFALMRSMPDKSVDVAILDPPYSERQHRGVRSLARRKLPDGTGKVDGCAARRVVDLGFEHFSRADCLRVVCELSRVVKRWSLIFCDDDLLPVWRAVARRVDGVELIRTGVWVRIGGTPQLTGDRPAAGCEYVVILHPDGRKRWGGGGHAAVWTHPIVANRAGHRQDRVHPTQKPESLMLELVSLFTEPDELVFDPFCGSGTTGVAALRYGRRFLGFERQEAHALVARERCEAAAAGSTPLAMRMKQSSLFPKV